VGSEICDISLLSVMKSSGIMLWVGGLKTLQNNAYVLDEWSITYLTFLEIKL